MPDSPVSYDDKGELTMSLLVAPVVFLAVLVACLLVLLVVGFVVKADPRESGTPPTRVAANGKTAHSCKVA